ncbi:oxygenase MpaB family protein [Aquiflexum gelatinilyticum]|uniref:DUF2236 domain-containing protein n=1 Tax=Aquiflexum gelatinilyticum TaxID=2961943 RepID=A0A9X2T294_9BACT|nr:DUF2236 domain-containing protein [Aquiflexum gelatinilyticum]
MGKLTLYTNKNLESLRKVGDSLADDAVLFLIGEAAWCEKINSWKALPSKKELASFPAELKSFFLFFHQAPDFIVPGKVKTAQEFFDKEGNLYLSLLGFYSLPYCYAFADGAQVLVRSKRITDEVGMRLSETALFLLDCFVPGTFIEENKSLLTIAKVRLIHAFSRYFVSKYAKDWNSDWGLPINQEDMIGTNLAFSLMVMRGMEKLNRFPGIETHEAVLHYWKVIGHYLGIDIAFWPETAKESFELEKLIRKRHVRPSEAGNTLIRPLLGFYEKSIPDTTLSSLSETLVAYFVGKEVAGVLGIKEKAKLPKSVYALVLDFNFLKQNGGNPSYLKTRTQFLEQSKTQFGKELSLNIPVPKRP